MNLFKKAIMLKAALGYGEQLANSATWKQATTRMNALVGLFSCVLPFVGGLENVGPQTLTDLAAGVGAVVSVYNSYTHYATSSKVGLFGASVFDR
jgi:hypothetical protein